MDRMVYRMDRNVIGAIERKAAVRAREHVDDLEAGPVAANDAARAVLEGHEGGELARLRRLVEDGRLEAERLEPARVRIRARVT